MAVFYDYLKTEYERMAEKLASKREEYEVLMQKFSQLTEDMALIGKTISTIPK